VKCFLNRSVPFRGPALFCDVAKSEVRCYSQRLLCAACALGNVLCQCCFCTGGQIDSVTGRHCARASASDCRCQSRRWLWFSWWWETDELWKVAFLNIAGVRTETAVLPCQVFTAGSDAVVRMEVLIFWGEFYCVTENLLESAFCDVALCVCSCCCCTVWAVTERLYALLLRCLRCYWTVVGAVTAVFELLLNGCRRCYCAIWTVNERL